MSVKTGTFSLRIFQLAFGASCNLAVGLTGLAVLVFPWRYEYENETVANDSS